MFNFLKRIKSPEMEKRHYNDLKSVLVDPTTEVHSHMENGETIFVLKSNDGRVHQINYKVDQFKRKNIVIKTKESAVADKRIKRTFVARPLQA